MKLGRLILAAAVLLLMAAPVYSVGNTVGLNCVVSWNANTETDLAGYKLYVGTAPGSYGPPQTILKPATSVSCASVGLTQGGQYYATLTAFNTAGNESQKAVEVPFLLVSAVPAVPGGLKIQ